MSSVSLAPHSAPDSPLTEIFPDQGDWTLCDFLAVNTNRPIELVDGNLAVLEMPTTSHQFTVLYLYRQLFAFALTAVPVSVGGEPTWEIADLFVPTYSYWAGGRREDALAPTRAAGRCGRG